jgi:RHS repeat-associated protein
MERENAVNEDGYDFGARLYNSWNGKWMAVDPLAMKYPGISTYAFVANSPIVFVDPDGMEIWIHSEVKKTDGTIVLEKFQYKDGKLMQNGKEFLYIGDDFFVMSVHADLKFLSTVEGNVSERLKVLENSENIHVIRMTAVETNGNMNIPENSSLDRMNIPTGSTTYYNPDDWIAPNGEHRNPKSALTHELLGHGYDTDQGISLWNSSYGPQMTGNGVPMNEVNAIKIENETRGKVGDGKRTKYDGIEIPSVHLD